MFHKVIFKLQCGFLHFRTLLQITKIHSNDLHPYMPSPYIGQYHKEFQMDCSNLKRCRIRTANIRHYHEEVRLHLANLKRCILQTLNLQAVVVYLFFTAK